MHKSYLLVPALLLLWSQAHAQLNTTTVSQVGNAQTGNATQTGNGNQSTIQQRTGTASSPNTGNAATTVQTAAPTNGAINQVFINQLNGADYNQGHISQSGGSANTATIEQNGLGVFRSGGVGLRGNDPLAPASPTGGNYATIDQVGGGNTGVMIRQNAGINGGSQANYGRISQQGNRIDGAAVDQNNQSLRNSATLSQFLVEGLGTQAVIQQNDDSQDNQARLTQGGSANVGQIGQSLHSDHNKATLTQQGGNSYGTMYQQDNASANDATVTQVAGSVGNNATVLQTDQSRYNQATITQAGSSGGALIEQSTQVANNVGTIEQGVAGQYNDAVIVQTYASDGSSTAYGSGNSASIKQNLTTASSTGNQAMVQQGFNGGVSPVTGGTMVSNKNEATVSQEHDSNVTNLLQGGSSNQATVTQRGYSTLKGVDTGLLVNPSAGQYGNNNVLTVQQNGTMAMPNIGHMTQIGMGNTGTLTQTSN